jgi:hypothetical protein
VKTVVQARYGRAFGASAYPTAVCGNAEQEARENTGPAQPDDKLFTVHFDDPSPVHTAGTTRLGGWFRQNPAACADG